MENLKEIDARVDRIVCSRVKRLVSLADRYVKDPRAARGLQHKHAHIVVALTTGVLTGRGSLRAVEKLSQRLELGRRRGGISDGSLSHTLGLYDEHTFDALLVQTVRDAKRRREMSCPGFKDHWVAIDGKYSTLNHDCGGLAQRFERDDKSGVYWRVGVLRAVLISSPNRQALGQRVMPRATVAKAGATKAKFTGEITNLPPFINWLREQYGDLVTNFSLDAGLWSKALFLAMDQKGYGLICGLKKNKPDLFQEAERAIRNERRKNGPSVDTGWVTCSRGEIRRKLWRTTALNGYDGWKNLRQVILIEQTTRARDGSEKVELRYFVTNATTGKLGPTRLARLIRQHWGIENDCNWSFDLELGEDAGRWCTQNKAILALAVIRMIAYNMLQHLRKSHVQVRHKHASPSPRSWVQTFELVRDALRRHVHVLLTALRQSADAPVGESRASPASG